MREWDVVRDPRLFHRILAHIGTPVGFGCSRRQSRDKEKLPPDEYMHVLPAGATGFFELTLVRPP
jgi:hypothetical protein